METQLINIINDILVNFDFTFIFIINLLTYIVIKIIDKVNGDKCISVNIKRLVLIICIILISIIYKVFGDINNIIMINSIIFTPVAWSWVFKPICKHFGIDYKQIENTIN